MTSVLEELKALASVDLFKSGRTPETFIGRPFYFDYSKLKLLVNDKWKQRVGGLPEGALVLLAYDGEPEAAEFILARITGPTTLPSDSDVISSMVEYYKEETPGESATKLDTFTRYEFMFSGVECRILGTFYKTPSGRTAFGSDVESFFSPHNYSAYKATGRVLEYVVNFREDAGIPGAVGQIRIGCVRYSSTRRLTAAPSEVSVYVSTLDFVGKRTALFGMTRTGKSNTVKKLVEATLQAAGLPAEDGQPLAPVGQIIFDINGEYANANPQDEGTAIYEAYQSVTTRYSILDKPNFKVMKLNFHRDLEAGFGMLTTLLSDRDTNYLRSFCSIELGAPPPGDQSAQVRWQRLVAAYRACLHAAGFDTGTDRVRFQGEASLNQLSGLDPTRGLSMDETVSWFSRVWDVYNTNSYLTGYPAGHQGREWANEDLKAVLVMLTRKRTPAGAANIDGFRILRQFADLHTPTVQTSFESDIIDSLRNGNIVIVDLSQGEATIQNTYSERICARIFADSMEQFISNRATNHIQLYFEEAHNLFPRQSSVDLRNVYNRLAKEGAKLRLGMVYATQEVTSVSPNILKNTQNWFIAHLNNRDELKEVEKFYDFSDFSDSVLRSSDKGFIRMKTYSNSFVIPVQVDRFAVRTPDGI